MDYLTIITLISITIYVIKLTIPKSTVKITIYVQVFVLFYPVFSCYALFCFIWSFEINLEILDLVVRIILFMVLSQLIFTSLKHHVVLVMNNELYKSRMLDVFILIKFWIIKFTVLIMNIQKKSNVIHLTFTLQTMRYFYIYNGYDMSDVEIF